MIPLRDDIPSRRVPFVTYALILANVFVFAYEIQLGRDLDRFFVTFGLVPARLRSARDPVIAAMPVFTSMFLHGGIAHLIGNMLYLHIFGDNVEDRLGHGRFLLFYLGCGVVAGLVQVALLGDSRIPMIGASGAIAGVTGAYFVFFRHARVLTLVPLFFIWRIVPIPAVALLLFWFAMQLVSGAAELGGHGASAAGVAWWAHVGGFACGAFVGPLVAPSRW